MKIKSVLLGLTLISFAIGPILIPNCLASSETYTNRITVEVPSYLFINADQKDLTFSFSDYQTGAETQSQRVAYTVLANNMNQSEGAPALMARLDGTFPHIDFKAQVGAYTKEGGNTELGPASSDFLNIGESDTILAKKTNSQGDGNLLRGQVEVNYKAVATSTLSAGEYSQQLTITLTDI